MVTEFVLHLLLLMPYGRIFSSLSGDNVHNCGILITTESVLWETKFKIFCSIKIKWGNI